MKDFKPMLAIDSTNELNKIVFPKLMSFKLDGIRCIFHPTMGLVSRSFKPIPNKQLQQRFAPLLTTAKELNIIFDGEIYCHGFSFQNMVRLVMTEDFDNEKTVKKLLKEGLDTERIKQEVQALEFHCFDIYDLDSQGKVFTERLEPLKNIIREYHTDIATPVLQVETDSVEDIMNYFDNAIDEGYEGLILRAPDSPYKFGRSTLREQYMLKVKPFKTFDAKIIGVQQSTIVDDNVKRTINELGRSVTSKKKGDRVLIDKASAFIVEYEGKQLKVSIAMTDPEKENVWRNRDKLIGQEIEYKGMLIGAKDLPRHPVFVRYREDK